MKGLFLKFILFFSIPSAFSQTPQTPSFVELNRAIAKDEMNKAIENPNLPVSGESIRALIEKPAETCEKNPPPTKLEDKTSDSEKVEILLIVEGTTADQGHITFSKDQTMQNMYQVDPEEAIQFLNKAVQAVYHTPTVSSLDGYYSGSGPNPWNLPPAPTPYLVNNPINLPNSLDPTVLKNWIAEAKNTEEQRIKNDIGGGQYLTVTPELQNTLYVETIVQTISRLGNLSDKDLSKQIAGAISGIAKSDEEKYQLLNIISDRLYKNYNDARNPGANNVKNNPNGEKINESSLSLSQIFGAAAMQDTIKGGVCTDISEAIAKIGEELFPDQDVLVVNAGSHFGVLIAGKKESRVIDGPFQTSMHQQLNLSPSVLTQNIRVSKVTNGHLKEIAVMDTQLGDLVKSTTGSPVPILKSGANFNKVIAQAKFKMSGTEKRKNALTVAAGQGALLESNVTVIAAKLSTDTKKSSSYVTLGSDVQTGKTDRMKAGGNEYHINLAAGFDRTLIRYVNPKVKIDFTTGAHMNSSLGLNRIGIDDFGSSGSLDLLNKINIQNTPKRNGAIQWQAQGLVDHSLGSKNWGASTGSASSFTGESILKTLGKLSFHMNQINLSGSATKPISANQSLVVRGNYVGSNVGQSMSVLSGINVKAKNGADIFYFVGAETSKMKGYQTKNSLLVGTNGGKAGLSYAGKNGKFTGSAAVSNLAPKQKPQVDVTAKYLINPQKKKKRIPASE